MIAPRPCESLRASFSARCMAIRKPKVVVTRKLPEPVEARMRELFDTVLSATTSR